MKMESFSKKMQESQCERGVDSRDSSITTQLVGRVMEILREVFDNEGGERVDD